jgi:DNA-directed RNA polymerase specialized sigma24 family protein
MSPKYRDVFLYYALERRSCKETAKRFGLSLGTVTSRIHKVREALREAYREDR